MSSINGWDLGEMNEDDVHRTMQAFSQAEEELAYYKYLEAQGLLIKLPCKIGDPLYWISPEDDEGNEIDTVKQYDGGVASFVVSAEGVRVADKDATREILEWSQETDTEYAYLTREKAEAKKEANGGGSDK